MKIQYKVNEDGRIVETSLVFTHKQYMDFMQILDMTLINYSYCFSNAIDSKKLNPQTLDMILSNLNEFRDMKTDLIFSPYEEIKIKE